MREADLAALLTELERMRKRLLDQSNRNPLLNYRHPKAGSLRVVEEVPSKVFEHLAVSQSPLIFDSLPEPPKQDIQPQPGAEQLAAPTDTQDDTAETWALANNINPSYDLPATRDTGERRHRDNKLQTLLFAEALERRLQTIDRKSRSALAETGANMLHLMFGFVEWLDGSVGDPDATRRHAPLVLMPVALERDERTDRATNTFRYRVRRSGEDWSTNVTLQEKCRVDGIALPSMSQEDEHLEAYFAAVENILPAGWRLRRWVTLGTVSFAKILMWRDLDPKNWTYDRLLGRTVLQAALGGKNGIGDQAGAGPIDQVYEIDTLTNTPLTVTEADSSQHSVLVDVQAGKNLVVEGPPGTGKSQTIVNLIANALFTGKRVLFVAEKHAALDVVYRRLKRAKLGEFCLALHSQVQRAAFLAEIVDGLNLRGTASRPAEFRATETQLASDRKSLSAYVNRLHTKSGALDLSPFTVVWRARLLLDRLGPATQKALENLLLPNPLAVTPALLAQGRATMDRLSQARDATAVDLDGVRGHPWEGVTSPLESQEAQGNVVEWARKSERALQQLTAATNELSRVLGAQVGETLQQLETQMRMASPIEVPQKADPEIVRALWTAGQEERLSALVERLSALQSQWGALPIGWRTPASLADGAARKQRAALEEAAAFFGRKQTLGALTARVSDAQALACDLEAFHGLSASLAADLEVEAPTTLPAQILFVRLVRGGVRLGAKAWATRAPAFRLPTARAVLERAAEQAETLREQDARLEKTFPVSFRPQQSELIVHLRALATAPGFLPWLWSGAYRTAVTCYRTMRQRQKASRQAMQHEMFELLRHWEAVSAFVGSDELRAIWGSDELTIHAPFREAHALAVWHESALASAQTLGVAGNQLVGGLWNAPAEAWQRASARLGSETPTPDAADLIERIKTVFAQTQPGSFPRAITSSSARMNATGLQQLRSVTDHAARVAVGAGLDVDSSVVSDLLDGIAAWERAAAAEKALDGEIQWVRDLGFDIPHARGGLEPLRDVAASVAALRASGLPNDWQRWLVSDNVHIRNERLRESVRALWGLALDASMALAGFEKATGLHVPAWMPGTSSLVTATFDFSIQRLGRALERVPALYRWGEQQAALHAARQSGLGDIAGLVLNGTVRNDCAADAYEAAVLMAVGQHLFAETGMYGAYGEHLQALRVRFQDLDRKLIDLTRDLVRAKLIDRPGIPGAQAHRVSELTEEALLRHEAEKRKRFIPVRALFQRAGAAIQNLKPCYLMSPFAVAQYLDRDAEPFDLVIMDEASQLRPENALGAIARAKQIVVVGDTKQLPPTDFFQKVQADGDVGMDEAAIPAESGLAPTPAPDGTVLQRAESILHLARDKFPQRTLEWHYRSRHPKLIAFSNREFYQSRLILFPVPGTADKHLGVHFHRIAGRWENGTNALEATHLVNAAREHAVAHPNLSLMIVAMNREQADLIDELLTKVEKDDPVWASYCQSWEHRAEVDEQEPFVVKNLENVQGDERDVVMISVTYGPDQNGNLFQRFGPINADGGERRLNVLFTRARQRLEIFCSFEPEAIRVERTSGIGLRVFQNYLLYAKDEQWAQGQDCGRPPDSDFEVAVARALQSRGVEVKAQVGVAGYFIDLAVVDPDHPMRFLLGIECDGKTYHSAKSARDRDRLRQQVLERLGWTIHRIWSTDWFRDPDSQVSRILGRLKQHVTSPPARSMQFAPRLTRSGTSSRPSAPSPPIGSAKYEFVEELHGGGMAECYRARDRESGQTVFFKRVRVGSAHAAALQREIDIYGRLQYAPCTHVLAVLDRERNDDYVALITEFADGGDLLHYVQSFDPPRLAISEALSVATTVARGLAALHEMDIVHRDLKPENVLRSGGIWKIADFGIAKNLAKAAPGATFQQAGSYGYAAPEQFFGTEAHPSADVYSFGKVLVFMVTGHTDLDHLPVEHADLRRLAFRCAAQTPGTRPTIAEVLEQLEQIAGATVG